MAFTSVHLATLPIGNKRMSVGTYASAGGSTGGDVTTGLRVVEEFFAMPTGSAVVADDPVYNETLPLVDTAVTIVTTANSSGNWMAIGV